MVNEDYANQAELIMEYFKKHPRRNIKHPEVVDWAVNTYKKRTKKVFRDPDRAIRKLAQEGYLIKISKGVYKYEPGFIVRRELNDFTQAQKEAIIERDDYRCVICGRGVKDGIELQVDHIKPKDLGGTNSIENGQTLCAQHNFQKKNYKQTESGKRYFIRLYEAAKKNNHKQLQAFCAEILEVYEKRGINGHIIWKR
ncbi:MAG: HNH endonuclease [Candidatus Micrarchaeota archaeon]|nr:HNH endonuclease [Candidatus Micrarchaeota archaeon]MDE1847682.1 HNH endonuclease [Candidatus Micrarchaeota archaeon]MDE1864503.1 HNH endonuclease [Candidatus Micrarchaeota archaeon]